MLLFGAENCIISSVSTQNYLYEVNKLLRHYVIQTLVVLGNIVDVIVIADGFEVTTSTFYLAFIRATVRTFPQIIAF